MKPILPLLLTTAALCHADPAKEKPVSHLPEKGLGQLIVDKLDITTFRSSLGPRRLEGQRHFADLGMKPASVTDEFVDMSDDEWTFTLRVMKRGDQNGDGIEDISLLLADISKIGSYAGGDTLLVTRYRADGDLVALTPESPEPEPGKAPPPAAESLEGEKPVSHLPEKGLGQLIVDRLDITTFGNSLWARRYPGQRHFADLGMKPASVTDAFVDMSDEEWTFTIRVLERRDQNRDGIEDIAIRVSDVSKIGTYAAAETLLVTRFTADGELIALACGASEPEEKAPPPAADSPEGVVAALYKAHTAGNGPFFQDKDRARLDQTFTTAFADLLWKDAQQPEGEAGAISADPLIDAQDGEAIKLSFLADKPKDGKVLVTASFHLLGKARRVRFRMEQEGGAWKVADILGNDFTSLRETLEKAYPARPPQAR